MLGSSLPLFFCSSFSLSGRISPFPSNSSMLHSVLVSDSPWQGAGRKPVQGRLCRWLNRGSGGGSVPAG